MREAHQLGRGACRGNGDPEHACYLQVRRRRAPLRPPGRTLPSLFVAFMVGGATGWWVHARTSRTPPAAPLRVTADSPHSVATGTSNDSEPVAELRRHSLQL